MHVEGELSFRCPLTLPSSRTEMTRGLHPISCTFLKSAQLRSSSSHQGSYHLTTDPRFPALCRRAECFTWNAYGRQERFRTQVHEIGKHSVSLMAFLPSLKHPNIFNQENKDVAQLPSPSCSIHCPASFAHFQGSQLIPKVSPSDTVSFFFTA